MSERSQPSARPERPRLSRRLCGAVALLAAPLALSAAGLPQDVYTPAWIAGALLAAALLLGLGGSWMSNASLAFAGLAAALVLADLTLRSPLGSSLFPRTPFASFRWPDNPDLRRYRANGRYRGPAFGDLAGMTGREDDRDTHELVWSTDGRGLRNPPPPPGSPLDAILLADSFGAGTVTTDAELWVTRLRRDFGIEVYGIATPGGPWGELLNLGYELPGLELRPGATLLWALFTGNDLEDRYRDYLEPRERNGRVGRAAVRFDSFRNASPLRRLWEARFEEGLDVRRARHDPHFLWVDEYAQRSLRSAEAVRAHSNHPRLARVFEAMAGLARRRGLRVVVATIPTKWETYAWLLAPEAAHASRAPSGFSVAAEELARSQGFAFLDLKPALVAEARAAWEEGAYVFWKDDTHWNGRGQEAAARAVAPLLSVSELPEAP